MKFDYEETSALSNSFDTAFDRVVRENNLFRAILNKKVLEEISRNLTLVDIVVPNYTLGASRGLKNEQTEEHANWAVNKAEIIIDELIDALDEMDGKTKGFDEWLYTK